MATSDLGFKGLIQQIKQFEATTGRKVSEEAMRGFLGKRLEAELATGIQREELSLRKAQEKRVAANQATQLAQQEEAREVAASAAKTSGIIQTGEAAATLGLLGKDLGVFGGTTPAVTGIPSLAEATAIANQPISLGAQTLTAPSVTAPVLDIGAPAAVETGAGGLALPLAGVAAGGLIFSEREQLAEKLPGGEKEIGALGGAIAGAAAGSLLGPVGTIVGFSFGAVGGLIGDATVICTELHTQ